MFIVRLILAVLLCCALAPLLPAASSEWTPPRMPPTAAELADGPVEQRLLWDVADGALDEHTLISAALIASGVSDAAQLLQYERQFSQVCDELRLGGAVTGSSRQQAEAVFEFLHRRVLTGPYDAATSDMRAVFDQGRYNCASSTVLFNAVAAEMGLKSTAVAIPGHVFSVVVTRHEQIDVEITCREWFTAVRARSRSGTPVPDNFSAHTSGTGVPDLREAKVDTRRTLTEAQLIGIFYYNRAIDSLSRDRHSEAIAAGLKALQCDPDSTAARGNLLATFNNWALDCCGQGDYSKAVDILDQGLLLAPQHATFRLNYLYVHGRWSDSLRESGQQTLAAARLRQAALKYPGEPYLQRKLSELEGTGKPEPGNRRAAA